MLAVDSKGCTSCFLEDHRVINSQLDTAQTQHQQGRAVHSESLLDQLCAFSKSYEREGGLTNEYPGRQEVGCLLKPSLLSIPPIPKKLQLPHYNH